ncbi:hypothetical protein [Legionella erythra]|uniref:Uncharacterized protein n=2 Tax=Legionella erythra TaxID=448 RepID=A0A0W0TQ50_LEGER|nr:hypothetical protein [Legionella erythra]KTC97767.1 hypothetical protein Lery_1606 [Legionella erythra]
MFKFRYWSLLLVSHSLYALTTLTVTLSSDNNPGGMGDVGDLRYMLNLMNQDLNTIPDDYAIVFASPMTIQLNGILPVINNSPNPMNITIGNPGPVPTVIIDGNSGAYSGFFIPTGNVTIQNMIFQNLTAKGGNGGDGISGGGGGLGAGGAIYAPQSFLNGSNPSITLMNVSINNCSAVGGNGGNYLGPAATGHEGGGGGFSGNGGSITTTGITGGAGGGGYGGDGGDVTLSTTDMLGGGGGGGLGSRATVGVTTNLGHGGSDQNAGLDGNGYGLTITAGSGGGGNSGGNNAGGGGGGAAIAFGGGGGGSLGANGMSAQGNIPPLQGKFRVNATPSGGNGGDGAGGGGGGVVIVGPSNGIDGQAGSGGYGGGGGGSGLGGAIFVDSNLNLTVQALPGIPTVFNTSNNTTQAGTHGAGGPGGTDGLDGSAMGNSIFLRAGSSLTLRAQNANDILTLGNQVAFADDTVFGAGNTSVFVNGNGSVIYNGTTDYLGIVKIDNANFKVNGQIDQASVFVCRNTGISSQRGTLSGRGVLTGNDSRQLVS